MHGLTMYMQANKVKVICFLSYKIDIIAGEMLPMLTSARGLWPLSIDGSIARQGTTVSDG